MELCASNVEHGIMAELEKGASVHQLDWRGMDCIAYAMKANNHQLLKKLLAHSKEPIKIDTYIDKLKANYLLHASKCSSIEIMMTLLDFGANPNIADRVVKISLLFIYIFSRFKPKDQ